MTAPDELRQQLEGLSDLKLVITCAGLVGSCGAEASGAVRHVGSAVDYELHHLFRVVDDREHVLLQGDNRGQPGRELDRGGHIRGALQSLAESKQSQDVGAGFSPPWTG